MIAATSLPPISNRGVTVTAFAVHWFAASTEAPLEEIVSVHAAFFDGLSLDLQPHGGYGYKQCWRGFKGISVYTTPGRADKYIQISGDGCEALGTNGVATFAAALSLVPTSRLDVAWDVQGFTPQDMLEWWEAGNVVSRAHRDSMEWRRNRKGRTLYIGSRTSNRFLRCYDMRGPTRIELECKGARSVFLWQAFMASSETDWSDTALGVLRDFVDFRDRSGSDAPARCPLLPLWEAFVGHAPATPFPLPRKECRLERSMKFLEKQVAGSFSLVVDYLNTIGEQSLREYLAKLYLKGRDRRATRQERALNRAYSEWQYRKRVKRISDRSLEVSG
jgi:Replication initiation factor